MQKKPGIVRGYERDNFGVPKLPGGVAPLPHCSTSGIR